MSREERQREEIAGAVDMGIDQLRVQIQDRKRCVKPKKDGGSDRQSTFRICLC